MSYLSRTQKTLLFGLLAAVGCCLGTTALACAVVFFPVTLLLALVRVDVTIPPSCPTLLCSP